MIDRYLMDSAQDGRPAALLEGALWVALLLGATLFAYPPAKMIARKKLALLYQVGLHPIAVITYL